MAADIPLFHSDTLQPMAISSMRMAAEQLRQQPQARGCEVGFVLVIDRQLCLIVHAVALQHTCMRSQDHHYWGVEK
jgi:hypothetical protein